MQIIVVRVQSVSPRYHSLIKAAVADINCIHTHLDQLKAWLSRMVQHGEGFLQSPPSYTLSAACLPHQHGGVSRVFGLIKLDDFGHAKRSHLQTALAKLGLYSLL